MKKVITQSILWDAIDQSKLYQGKKGKYLNLTFYYNDEKDQYDNNGIIVQSQSKEEKNSGKENKILGNGKIVWSEEEIANDHKKDRSGSTDLPF